MLLNYPIFYIRSGLAGVFFPKDGLGRQNADLIDVNPEAHIRVSLTDIQEFLSDTGFEHDWGSWFGKPCLWFETREEMVLFALKFGLSSRGIEGTEPIDQR